MSQFITRIELHNADWGDYEQLHTAMANAGFTRTIAGPDGRLYQLPNAEYCKLAALTSSQVGQQAQAAANSTGKSSWVLVTEGLCWFNLPAA